MTVRGRAVAVVLTLSVVAACASKKKEPPQRPRTYCENLLLSETEHPSAIRLPPAEYDFCRNQVAGEVFRAINRDGGASER